jgi:hypothetical protein
MPFHLGEHTFAIRQVLGILPQPLWFVYPNLTHPLAMQSLGIQ